MHDTIFLHDRYSGGVYVCTRHNSCLWKKRFKSTVPAINSLNTVFSQDFKVSPGNAPPPENFEIFNSWRCILLHFEVTNADIMQRITWSICCKKPLLENWAYSVGCDGRRLNLKLLQQGCIVTVAHLLVLLRIATHARVTCLAVFKLFGYMQPRTSRFENN